MGRESMFPPDVAPEQVWRAPDGQLYRVDAVSNSIVFLYRCTPAGGVLNQRYIATSSVDRMQAQWDLISGG